MWGAVVGGLISLFKEKSQQKARLREAKVTAEEERILKGMDSSGWKDEFLVLLVGFPYIMAFIPIPEVQEAATNGFKLLHQFPEWWRYSFISIIGAVFGIKKLLDWKGGMK
jgi:hypothetical protein